MKDVLYNIRVEIHYTNSKSYQAGCKEVYVVATSEVKAYEIVKKYFKKYFEERKELKKVARIIFCNPVVNYIEEPNFALERQVLTEKQSMSNSSIDK